jgi:16S rRNA processing protein RimM
MAQRLCVGVVVGAHGIRGQLRIKSFTLDPAALTRYGPLETDDGRLWQLDGVSVGVKSMLTASVAFIADRTQAEAAKGVKLYVRREVLPDTQEDEFYVADLLGLTALSTDGGDLGTVTAVFNYGAGDVVAVIGPRGELLVPFTRSAVPVVDLVGRRVVIDPPILTDGDRVPEDDGG